jgi:diazepam-binding inhibitor (GABA receptor modulating acyl-CoA-binding protein)
VILILRNPASGVTAGFHHHRSTEEGIFHMSDDLQARFDQARADSQNLPEKPDTPTLLKLYALYKQGNAGDVQGDRPPLTAMVDRAKWDVWNELKGRAREEAQQGYVDLVESLK